MLRRFRLLAPIVATATLIGFGCAHQREPVFPGQSRGFWGLKPAPPASASNAHKSKKVSAKSERVEQNARRMPGFDNDDPFDFDQAVGGAL